MTNLGQHPTGLLFPKCAVALAASGVRDTFLDTPSLRSIAASAPTCTMAGPSPCERCWLMKIVRTGTAMSSCFRPTNCATRLLSRKPMSERRTIPVDEVLLVAISIGLAAWWSRAYVADDYFLTRAVYVSQWSGYTALGMLALSLLTTPLGARSGHAADQNRSNRAARVSRNAGIASGPGGAVHLVVVMTTYLDGNWWVVFDFPYLQSGATADWRCSCCCSLCSIKRLMRRCWVATLEAAVSAVVCRRDPGVSPRIVCPVLDNPLGALVVWRGAGHFAGAVCCRPE